MHICGFSRRAGTMELMSKGGLLGDVCVECDFKLL